MKLMTWLVIAALCLTAWSITEAFLNRDWLIFAVGLLVSAFLVTTELVLRRKAAA